jgi:hypothetical protein
MAAALVSALPASHATATDSNTVHGILLMATALLRGVLAAARATQGALHTATM